MLIYDRFLDGSYGHFSTFVNEFVTNSERSKWFHFENFHRMKSRRMIENRNDLLILCYFFFVHFICGPLIQYTQIVGWSVFQENMMFCLSKRMDSLNEDAAFLWFAVIFLWYWILRVCVYLLFCYFLFVRLNEWRFSGKLNSYLNKIKKGKLKEFALWQRTNGKKWAAQETVSMAMIFNENNEKELLKVTHTIASMSVSIFAQ